MNFKKFKPSTKAAITQIETLISRGGKLVKDTADAVEIRRLESIATIDSMGRVAWRPASSK